MKKYYDEKFKGYVWKPDCTEEWLQLIWDIGVDYDGYETSKELKSLIDELVGYSSEAMKCLKEGKLYSEV